MWCRGSYHSLKAYKSTGSPLLLGLLWDFPGALLLPFLPSLMPFCSFIPTTAQSLGLPRETSTMQRSLLQLGKPEVMVSWWGWVLLWPFPKHRSKLFSSKTHRKTKQTSRVRKMGSHTWKIPCTGVHRYAQVCTGHTECETAACHNHA